MRGGVGAAGGEARGCAHRRGARASAGALAAGAPAVACVAQLYGAHSRARGLGSGEVRAADGRLRLLFRRQHAREQLLCVRHGRLHQHVPQPGRGSGQKWSEDTCDDIRASSERNGLVWAGTDLPKTGPEDGESHYVSLHIWDKTNFHWLRMVRVYRRRACRARVCSAKLLASLTRETAHARKPRMCVPPSSLCSFAHRSACLLCGVGFLSRASCLSRCLSA